MRKMVLYVFDLADKSLAWKRAIEFLGKARPFRTVAQTLPHELQARPARCNIRELAEQIGPHLVFDTYAPVI